MIHIVLENGSTLNLPLDEIASIGGFVEDGVSWLALEIAEPFFGLGPAFRLIELTEEAMIYALEDFDYLISLIVENSPWPAVINRRLGISFQDLVDINRFYIQTRHPMATLADLPDGINWQRENNTPRDIAADWLFTMPLF